MADTLACFIMDRDPEVTRYIDGPWSDPTKHRAFIESRTHGPYPDGLGYWSIVARENIDELLGWILLIPRDGHGPEVEVGWRLMREHWGKGVAVEAAAPVLLHGFQIVELDRVIAEMNPANAASIRVAEKLGMVRTKALRNAGRNTACFELDREQFLGAQPEQDEAPEA